MKDLFFFFRMSGFGNCLFNDDPFLLFFLLPFFPLHSQGFHLFPPALKFSFSPSVHLFFTFYFRHCSSFRKIVKLNIILLPLFQKEFFGRMQCFLLLFPGVPGASKKFFVFVFSHLFSALFYYASHLITLPNFVWNHY